jgi:hypothetical protein
MKKYFKVNDSGNKFVKFQVVYSKGGMNYFNGKVEKRGYWVSVSVINQEIINGITIESVVLCSAAAGFKRFLLEVKRDSQKSFDQAIAIAESMQIELIDKILKSVK